MDIQLVALIDLEIADDEAVRKGRRKRTVSANTTFNINSKEGGRLVERGFAAKVGSDEAQEKKEDADAREEIQKKVSAASAEADKDADKGADNGAAKGAVAAKPDAK